MANRPLTPFRSVAAAAGLAAATLLAGCGTPNRGLESVHQPVVSRTDYVFDVAGGPRGLDAGEAARLAGWMATLRPGYGDVVAIDAPYGGSAAARADVAAVAARYGLLLADQAPVTGAAVAPGSVRVVVSRTRASVPNCPDYSRAYEPNFNAHTTSNYGCAVNSNLAAMIADPNDLVRGRAGSGDYEGVVASRAVSALREAKPTGDGGDWIKGKADSVGGGK